MVHKNYATVLESKISDYLILHPTHVVDGRKNSAPKFFMMYEEEVQPYRKTDYKPIIMFTQK